MNTLQITGATIVNKSVRRYRDGFYCWANLSINDEVFNLGDPYPSSTFPMCEAITQYIAAQAAKQPVTVSEKDFRQYFKGVKDGAKRYANAAEMLEIKGVSFN